MLPSLACGPLEIRGASARDLRPRLLSMRSGGWVLAGSLGCWRKTREAAERMRVLNLRRILSLFPCPSLGWYPGVSLEDKSGRVSSRDGEGGESAPRERGRETGADRRGVGVEVHRESRRRLRVRRKEEGTRCVYVSVSVSVCLSLCESRQRLSVCVCRAAAPAREERVKERGLL